VGKKKRGKLQLFFVRSRKHVLIMMPIKKTFSYDRNVLGHYKTPHELLINNYRDANVIICPIQSQFFMGQFARL